MRNTLLYSALIKPWRQRKLHERRRREAFDAWEKRGFSEFAPQFVKEQVLFRHSIKNAIWVETGTYHGTTTSFFAEIAPHVYTIEPQKAFFEAAITKFANWPNVTVLYGTSEEVFPSLIPTLSGRMNFWLDGHYSGVGTFKGPNECPIIHEMEWIARNLKHFSDISVFVDDIRLFLPGSCTKGYPAIDFLPMWARSHDLFWKITNDIFIATSSLRSLNGKNQPILLV